MPSARRASTVVRMSLVASATCCARPAVELQVLVDLRLLLAVRRLVERELDAVVAVGHHLAHQRRIVGGDVVADELRHVGEAHDPVVEVDPPGPWRRARRCRRRGRRPGTAASGRRPASRRTTSARRSPADTGRSTGTGRRGCAGCRRRRRSRRAAPCRARRSRRAAARGRSRPARWRGRCTGRRRARTGRCRRCRRRGRGGGRPAGWPGRRRPAITKRAAPMST